MPLDFFTQDEEIVVKLITGKSKSEGIVCDYEKEKLVELYPDVDQSSLEEHEMVFKVPSYGDSNRILDSGVRMDEDNINILPAQIRFERLVILAKRWSLTDANGKISKPNRENISKLHTRIAMFFALGLEKSLRERGLL